MSKTTAPLLSFDASGQLGQTMVFSSWRGIPYVRRQVTPSNPQTAEQQKTRNTFTWTEDVWKLAPSILRAPWEAFAKGQQFVGRNAWVGQNIKAMRGQADLALLVGSPGARGGLPPNSITPSGTAGGIDVAFAIPTPPTGWTLNGGHAIAIEEQQPEEPLNGYVYAGEDTSSVPPTATITGLTAAQAYRVSAWLSWTKPDGTLAYSPSLNGTATPT